MLCSLFIIISRDDIFYEPESNMIFIIKRYIQPALRFSAKPGYDVLWYHRYTPDTCVPYTSDAHHLGGASVGHWNSSLFYQYTHGRCSRCSLQRCSSLFVNTPPLLPQPDVLIRYFRFMPPERRNVLVLLHLHFTHYLFAKSK